MTPANSQLVLCRVNSHLHALSADGPVKDEPVTVIPPHRCAKDVGIPAPPQGSPRPGPGVRLNTALVEKKLQQTSAVAALLGSVFSEDAEPAPDPVAPPATQESCIGGLDVAHSRLLGHLVGRSTCPRAEFEGFAASVQLLPEGALDRLNEAAYDAASSPLIEDGDPLTIDLAVLEEMTK